MNVQLVSNDSALVDLLSDACRQSLNDLSIQTRWPLPAVDLRGLVVLDLDGMARPSDIDPREIERAGNVILVCSPEWAAAPDRAARA